MSVGAKHPRARRPRRHPAWWSSISRSVLDEPECSAMTNSPNRPSTKRGRPLVTDGRYRCSRCQRIANQRRAAWPGEDLCYSCVYTAMRTRGVESSCFSTRNSIVQPGEELDRLGNTRILLGREPIPLPQPFAEPLKSPGPSHLRRSRSISCPSQRATSHAIAAVAPRFVPKSVPNGASSKCGNRRLTAATRKHRYPDRGA